MIQFDYTLGIVLLGTTLVGITSGIVGCFVILQRQSLFGDALAHATLPGLAAMFLYTGTKTSPLLFIGATISAALGAYCISLINKHTTLKKETSLGIILSTAFGLGTVLLSIIQAYPAANKAGINKFLLGNAATLLFQDLIIIVIITLIVIATILICWKEFKVFIFNREFADAIGMKTAVIELVLTMITILTIIIGLQTVGAVLISSLLIAPATAAAQWTKKLHLMILLSAFCSCIATITGTLISSSMPHLPTGPIIIVIATLCTLLSIVCAPYWTHVMRAPKPQS
jgi:manganese/zinc/iron transport system permease protein